MYLAFQPSFLPQIGPPHFPYYDITTGANQGSGGNGYNADPGFDLATGMGSPNMLQLAWAINYEIEPLSNPPVVSLTQVSGQFGQLEVEIHVSGGTLGPAGFTAQWDTPPGDPTREATPGTGNPFYQGPQTIGRSGVLPLLPDGCHTAFVRAWDNVGHSTLQELGPLCACNGDQCADGQSCVAGQCCDNDSICGNQCCSSTTPACVTDRFCFGGPLFPPECFTLSQTCCSLKGACSRFCCDSLGEACARNAATGVEMCCPASQTCGGQCCTDPTTACATAGGLPTCCPKEDICDGRCVTGGCPGGQPPPCANPCGSFCCTIGEICVTSTATGEATCEAAQSPGCPSGQILCNGVCVPGSSGCGPTPGLAALPGTFVPPVHTRIQ